jgi:hypothetical protein
VLTPEQVETIEGRVRFIFEEHVATLHGVTNGVLQKLSPGNKHEYGTYCEALISETLEAISTLGDRASLEIPAAVVVLKADLNEEDRDKVLEIWRKALDTDLYRKRIESFKESLDRKMQGYGMAVDYSTFRFDLIESRYLVGTANASRSVAAKLKSALDLHVYADGEQHHHRPPASILEKANEVVDLRPNFLGFGLNLNKVIEHFLRRRKPDRRSKSQHQ